MQPAPQAGAPLPRLHLWVDPTPRRGYLNMALDEALLRRPEAWLRVYAWALPAVSYGYFDTRAVAEELAPGAQEYIRRWTGGGIVDHRLGQTYTLTLPARQPGEAAYPESACLYALIHRALAEVLADGGTPCDLLAQDAAYGGRACWSSPVAADIVGPAGNKLAGAAQRRSGGAVLHQGMIQGCGLPDGWETALARALAEEVLLHTAEEPVPRLLQEAEALCRNKYEAPAWQDESHGRRRSHSSL